jgi:outer membrane protein assembly factor BamB
MMKVSPTGKVLSEYRDPIAHHDQHHLDNGEIIYATLEALTLEQGASIEGGIPGSEAPGGIVYGDGIKHVDPSTGKVLFQWRAIDHLDPQKFKLNPHFDREHWPLINSVTVLKDGNILASLRSVSSVVIISRETGEVIWNLDDSVLAQQHCASELENGNILIFDNGTHRKGTSATFSRVIEVSRQTRKVVWQYVDKSMPMAFFSAFMGGAQRLQNGNTLITEAMFGRMFEVTMAGEVVWEYVNPHFANYSGFTDGGEELGTVGFDYMANAVFRSYKYTPEQIPWLEEVMQTAENGMLTPVATP